DLARPPSVPQLRPLRELSPPLVRVSIGLVEHVRERHPDAYAALVDEVELRLDEELSSLRAEDLGKIDTFRREEQRIPGAAVRCLAARDWAKVKAWADARTDDRSFWLKRDPARRRAWSLVREGAELGVMLAECPRPLDGAQSLDDAVTRYA